MGTSTRVAHLSSNHDAFDTRIFLKECRTLAGAGYDVVFVVPHERDHVRDGVRIRAVPVPGTRRERMLQAAWRVYVAGLDEDASIYHFHDPELIPYALLLKLRGNAVIYDVHEDRPKQIASKDWIHPRLRDAVAGAVGGIEWLASRVFDHTIAVTPSIAKRFPLQKTTLVQNYPIAEELVQAERRTRPGGGRRIAFVGGISSVRGIREMVDAMDLLSSDMEATLTLAGSFFPPRLENEVRGMPGWRHVEFVGWSSRDQVARLLAESDVGLVLYHPEPNHVEAQPNKLFEYMSAGLPVVASDFPLWREIVEGSGCGLLVDPLQPKEIAGAIRWLLAHPAEAEAMGDRGRHAVQSRYNWASEADRLLHVYERVAP